MVRDIHPAEIDLFVASLSGHPFHWGAGESSNYFPIARELGCTLKTKTAIKRAGLVLKRGAKPVGRAYYGAPIKDYCEIYIVEAHADTSTGKTLTREANDENT